MRKPRRVRATKYRESSESRSDKWIDHEVIGCQFQDVRHGKRMRQLLEQLAGNVGATTPWAAQDWANTKAAYRFFANDRIHEANILAGHFASEVRNKHGDSSTALLEIRYRRILVRPPIGKEKQYPELLLTVIHAQEKGAPKDRERIDWKLLTDLPVASPREAVEKLDWYAQRWKIETFHKILKSGCKVEEAKLRTAERRLLQIADKALVKDEGFVFL